MTAKRKVLLAITLLLILTNSFVIYNKTKGDGSDISFVNSHLTKVLKAQESVSNDTKLQDKTLKEMLSSELYKTVVADSVYPSNERTADVIEVDSMVYVEGEEVKCVKFAKIFGIDQVIKATYSKEIDKFTSIERITMLQGPK